MLETRSKLSKKPKPHIIHKNKSYSLKESVLYKITSIKRLERILQRTAHQLEQFSTDANYNVFNLKKKDGSLREIQAPKLELDIIQTRIASLLMHVAVPDYLHSGIKKRSNITNARVHIGDHPVLTLDIHHFYPSITQKSIHHFFHDTMKASSDIAGILAKLCTYQSHLPTGSRISMPLAFWANYQMFNQLYMLCKENNITMSVYVDDLTFSGQSVNKTFKRQVKTIIESARLVVHPEKTRLYLSSKPKQITGVIVTATGIRVMNRHHKAINSLINEMKPEQLNEVIGRLNAAGQIEPKYKIYAQTLRN